MDPQTDLPDLVEDLEVNIDELTTALAPLLKTQLSTTATSLPLLDKAKLYVLAAYSIESLLYSTLQASGVNAKEHAIFKELGRLKGYFGKIKAIEERPVAQQPKQKLDVGAAARFIKHGLAGNDKYDLERAERMAKERARAQLKAQQINKKFDDEGNERLQQATPKKRDFEDLVAQDAEDEALLEGLEDSESLTAATPATKKHKTSDTSDAVDIDSAPSPTLASQQSSNQKSSKIKGAKKSKSKSKSAETSDGGFHASQPSQEPEQHQSADSKRKTRDKKNKPSLEEGDQDIATVMPMRATRSRKGNAANQEVTSAPPSTEKPKRGRPKKAK
ncbi:hypothetical protein ACEQ8H_007175 [Pleosporales sp. CAS-2024a]